MPSSRRLTVAVLAAGALAGAPPVAAATPGWRWPVQGPVLHRFRTVADPFAAGQHRGIDIAAPVGAPVGAACSGRVAFAGTAGTAGRTVSVRCGAFTATYLHLAALEVRPGVEVRAGDAIGAAGRSGRVPDGRPQLHFGVRRTADRFGYVDPLRLLPRRRGSLPPPLLPALRRRPPGPLGSGPRELPAERPLPVARPVDHPAAIRGAARPGRSPAPVRAPLVAWAGLVLAAVALPGLGVRRARRPRVPARRARPAAR